MVIVRWFFLYAYRRTISWDVETSELILLLAGIVQSLARRRWKRLHVSNWSRQYTLPERGRLCWIEFIRSRTRCQGTSKTVIEARTWLIYVASQTLFELTRWFSWVEQDLIALADTAWLFGNCRGSVVAVCGDLVQNAAVTICAQDSATSAFTTFVSTDSPGGTTLPHTSPGGTHHWNAKRVICIVLLFQTLA